MKPTPTASARCTAHAAVMVVTILAFSSACSGGSAQPADPASPSPGDMTDVSHDLEPTEQMKQVARQQCLDDPELKVGYVRAVSPDNGEVLAELEIDCDQARAER